VAEEQKGFVAPNAVSISQAHFSNYAWFRAIYADETPVGFVMVYIDKEKPEYYLWRYMIDAEHQGKGYGRQALSQVIDYIKTLPKATEMFTSYVPGEGCPAPFYRKLGFEETGEWDGGEAVMKLELV
jgi:diamine N-acetyltransferase